jgi:hypothetical protein
VVSAGQQWAMQGHDVAQGQQLLHAHVLHAHLEHFRVLVHIVRNDVAPNSL